MKIPKKLERKLKKINFPQSFGSPSPLLLAAIILSKKKKSVLVVPESDLRVFQKIFKQSSRPVKDNCLPLKNKGILILTYREIAKINKKSKKDILWKNGTKIHEKHSIKEYLDLIGYTRKPYKPEAVGEWFMSGDRLYIFTPNENDLIDIELFGETMDDPRHRDIAITPLVEGDDILEEDYAKLGDWWLYRDGEIEDKANLPKDLKITKVTGFSKPEDMFKITYSDNIFSNINEEEKWKEFLAQRDVDLIQCGWGREWDTNLTSHEYWEDLKVWVSPKPSNQEVKKRIFSLDNLKTGDHLVHKDHGICKFGGLKTATVSGRKKEFLRLIFDGSDEILVPIMLLTRIQRYIGPPVKKLAKLGGKKWKKKVHETKKETLQFAKDLFKLYNTRKNIKREFVWEKDPELESTFSKNFPHKLTSEQLLALNEIFQDMSSEKIMNRILAGDVGYGKTEVALRAAFRVLMNNFQVALLAPTTVLVQQHYRRIKRRLENFDIKCFNLSRIASTKERDEAYSEINNGSCCFIVGTHALLNEKINFKKLGLLIIDEEQRFGVKHKEKITLKNKNIDVLTLSATPIPRTLFTSLVGLKDATTITTPPRGRLPIETIIKKWNENDAIKLIENEIQSNGKVFFLHNKINTIKKRESWLKDRFENVITIHGRLNPKTIEDRMINFTNSKKSILLTTTIIQNGVDFDNANTIIVEDATRLGLAQLHQLRGRIGRRDKKGTACFFTPVGSPTSKKVEERLKKLAQYSDLGAGFSIAKADLELRGAGEVLGTNQSGHIWQLGLELFAEMLHESVINIKQSETKNDPEIAIPFFGMLPGFYEEQEKLSVYSYIFEDANEQDLKNLKTEWYKKNEVTDSVEDLLLSSMIYKTAKSLPIKKASYSDKFLKITLLKKPNKKIPAKWLLENESLKIKVEPDARKILEKLDKLEQVIS